MKKLILAGVAVVLIGIVAVIVFVVAVSKAPFTVPEDRISFDYVTSRATINEYNQAGTDPETNIAIYTKLDSEQENSGIMIRIVSNPEFGEEVSQIFEERECNSSVSVSGNVNDVAYYKGTCDDAAYYTYLVNKGDVVNGIHFETVVDGRQSLDDFIQAFIE